MKIFRINKAPHLHRDSSVSTMMLDVCIALLPTLLWGIYVFGLRALTILFLSVFFCMGFEALWQFLIRRPFTLSNLSALVSGLLLTALLPVSVPLWFIPIASAIAMLLVKGVFGGLGKNPVNPAVTAKAILFLFFPAQLTRYTLPFEKLPAFRLSFSKPYLEKMLAPAPTDSFREESLSNLFTGSTAACIGEGSALMLLAGLFYLLLKKTVTWHVPFSYLATVAILALFLPKEGNVLEFMLRYLFSGGVVLAATFLATDPVTSPVTRRGKIAYGILCGALTVLIRQLSGGEGILFAILIGNLSAPLLDRLLRPRTYGTRLFRRRPEVIPWYLVWWSRAKALYEVLRFLFARLVAKKSDS